MMPPRVVIESPLRGRVPGWVAQRVPGLYGPIERFGRWLNKRYARACMRDSLARGEAPYASHLVFDQPGILDDADPADRALGMYAGFAWGASAQRVAVYVDRGVSHGMIAGIRRAEAAGIPIERRSLPNWRAKRKEG